jgi:hypothetical protein
MTRHDRHPHHRQARASRRVDSRPPPRGHRRLVRSRAPLGRARAFRRQSAVRCGVPRARQPLKVPEQPPIARMRCPAPPAGHLACLDSRRATDGAKRPLIREVSGAIGTSQADEVPNPPGSRRIRGDLRTDTGTGELVISRAFLARADQLSVPENRGVPGSSPGLAIAKSLQSCGSSTRLRTRARIVLSLVRMRRLRQTRTGGRSSLS